MFHSIVCNTLVNQAGGRMLKEKIAKYSGCVKKCHFVSDPCSEWRLLHFPGFKIKSQSKTAYKQLEFLFLYSHNILVFSRFLENFSWKIISNFSSWFVKLKPSLRHISLVTFTILLVYWFLLYAPIKGNKFILFICFFSGLLQSLPICV